MGANNQGSASCWGQTLRDSVHHDACADRRATTMPEEYRHQASPTKHTHAVEKAVARESWIVVSPGAMSPDPVPRPSLENGSIHLISPQPRVVKAAPEDYRPPPPLIDPTSRTSSTGSIPHGAGPPTAVTPANPNYKIGPDPTQNVSQVARERPHDTASIHVPPTPREAIGHLDAAQLHAKEDRESVGVRKRNRGSGMLGSMFGNHEPRRSMEEIESIHSTHAPEKERHGFRSLFGTSREKEREKEREQTRHRGIENVNDRTQWDISRLIGYTTSTSVEDWSVVMEICDKVNLNDSEAKEASKALRKDIQFGRPAVQLSAARLWAILMRNCGQYFVAHTTSRKFLGKIEEVAFSPATSPVVRDRLVEVIGTSVYLLRESKNLKPYQTTWKKLRLQLKLTHPVEGIEIPADDPILNPTPHRPPSSLRQLTTNELVQPEVPPNVTIVTQGIAKVELEPTPPGERRSARDDERERRRDRGRNAESTYGVISPEEDIRRLFEECEIARDNCRILADSLVYATPDSITANTVIKEFRAKCMKSQEIIGAQIDWATAIADRARAEQAPLNGPGEAPPTAEEQLLQALVMANGELNDVFKTYDDLERIAISEREEAEVRARSKVELRLDRSKYQQLNGGEVYMIAPDNHGPSRSQTHTPAPTLTPAQIQAQPPGHTRRPLPQPTPSSPHVNSLAPPPPAPHGPRPLSRNRTPSPNLGSDFRDHSTDESSQESEAQPILPSAKAMGKRRAEPAPEEEDEWPEHGSLLNLDNGNDGDENDGNPKPQEIFLYDAAEERKKQRALEGK
ncbi:TOM1-like protein 2 OS=Xenopus laevis GN=tom1l2 PE=2 SV=1 [Rhizoctonia solani AG-1 IB]|uniref:TOM1-like protein 2 n=1 Tax=Thanatephorus cucumeris (strain AG1-IB / isolate 7/3/14) TaxID=1108050 RepID=A0A0B7FVR1_THACB|nr:TOM1-like protein 2 OS=Xenopus laevis GN=tom1l2 PE=2 SV=1 [Rhizoctonia solani AG-1 IB]